MANDDPNNEKRISRSPGKLPGAEEAFSYANYLRGRYYAKKYTEDGFRKALDYLQSAIDSDPAYALAYSGLADTFYDASNLIFPPSEAMPKKQGGRTRTRYGRPLPSLTR